MIFSCFVRGLVPCVLLAISISGVSPAAAQTPAKRATPTPKAQPTASPTPAPYVLPETVATVDGAPIKRQDVETLTVVLAASQGKSLQDLPAAQQKQAYADVLQRVIADKLVSNAAVGEKVDDLAVAKGYAKLMSEYPTPQDFENQVKKSGKTSDQIKENIRKQLAQQEWLEGQVAPEIKVTPEEVQKFYKESPTGKFDVPELVRARHILAKAAKDAPPEVPYLAEQKINKLAERIKKGEAFEEVAKKESDDRSAEQNGGDLGYFSRDKIMPEIGDVAFKAKVNAVSAPVRTQFGYHLIQVLDHKAAHTATLDEARDQILAYLQSEKRKKAVVDVLKGLRDKAKITVSLP